ncbi:HipA family kinase [Sinorhizobium meliloti]|uniref:HipA family kinase n=1 Tax=Rhizobium meliloti TaxID=382 RepID=UPI000FD88A74|nr:HipA family kinase [Sinorhizobium meliloti]RVO57772.1 hypothetical protein CN092_11925 [Sinorhizobium meliloti]
MLSHSSSIDRAVGAVGFARVLAGAMSFKDSGIANVHNTYRGQVFVGGDIVRNAIIKDLPLRELANEAMIAAVASALKLPVPDAYLAFVPSGQMSVVHAPSIDGGNVMFASCDVDAPSVATIAKRGNFTAAVVRRIVDHLIKKDLVGLYEFDTWIANIDRHLGNLLLSGSGDFWMIDHGQCFSGPNWRRSDLDPSAAFANRLAALTVPLLTSEEVDKLTAAIGRVCDAVQQVDLRTTGESSYVPRLLDSEDFEALLVFLQERLASAPRLTAQHLGRLA